MAGYAGKSQNPDLAPVLARLSTTIGCAVTGTPADELARLVAAHGPPAVLAAIPAVAGYRKATGAIAALAGVLTPSAPSPARVPRCARCNDTGLLRDAEGWQTGETCGHDL